MTKEVKLERIKYLKRQRLTKAWKAFQQYEEELLPRCCLAMSLEDVKKALEYAIEGTFK